jgi:hypothetical protein
MRAALATSRGDSGQVFVFVALILMALVGMAALVIDVGSWYRADRQLQTAADAAALAGAQWLPMDRIEAGNEADNYAKLNGSKLLALSPVAIVSQSGAIDDTIDVSATAEAPGIFARIYGAAFNKVALSAHAQAQVRAPRSMKHVAPFAVSRYHPMISGPDCPCFDQPPEPWSLDKTGPGNFTLISLDGLGVAEPEKLASWIEDGFEGPLELGDYDGDPGKKYNSSLVRNAMSSRVESGEALLFPVYDPDALTGGGSNETYRVIGWAAFKVTEFTFNGSNSSITAYLTDFIATDLAGDTTPLDHDNDFGVRVITLTR